MNETSSRSWRRTLSQHAAHTRTMACTLDSAESLAMRDSRVGSSAQAEMIVGAVDSAEQLFPALADRFPDVFATSRMIALMELAGARAMSADLDEGQLSVGVRVNVEHTAATPIGASVRAVATLLEITGKLYRFKVEAFDEGGRIGAGEHVRAIVANDRLLEGARRRRVSAG
jgi:fluoroacetyl-CoA thioesterase